MSYLRISCQKSRMMGDYHVRFCERLGVKLPLSTRRLGVRCNKTGLWSFQCTFLIGNHGNGRRDPEPLFRASPNLSVGPWRVSLSVRLQRTISLEKVA